MNKNKEYLELQLENLRLKNHLDYLIAKLNLSKYLFLSKCYSNNYEKNNLLEDIRTLPKSIKYTEKYLNDEREKSIKMFEEMFKDEI